MITSDLQLRTFNVNKPWTRADAAEHSEAALASWGYENSTPRLGEAPFLPSGATDKLNKLLSISPGECADFDFPLWEAIAQHTDDYIECVGDLFVAAHAYTRTWRKSRSPTSMAPGGLDVFKGVAGDDLYDHALQVSRYGVLPRGDRPPERFRQEAYANINDNPEATAAELWGDLIKDRLLVLTDRSDPQTGSLMEPRLAYLLQKDATDPDSTKCRYVSDPRNGANERLNNDRHPRRIVPRHQNVARRVMCWELRYPTSQYSPPSET